MVKETHWSTFRLSTEKQLLPPVALTWHRFLLSPSEFCQDTRGQVVLAISWKTTTGQLYNYSEALSTTAVIRHRSPEEKTYWALGRYVGHGGWKVQTTPGQVLPGKRCLHRCCEKHFYMRQLMTTSNCSAVQNMWVGAKFHGREQRFLECLEMQFILATNPVLG